VFWGLLKGDISVLLVMHISHRCADTCVYIHRHWHMHSCIHAPSHTQSLSSRYVYMYCVCMYTFIMYYVMGELLTLKIKWEFSFTCLQRNYLGLLLRASVKAVLLTCARRSKWTIALLRFVTRRLIRL